MSAAGDKQPDDLEQRQKNTADVLTRCSEVRELDDGYALSYPATRAWAARLDTFTTAWRVSCPHMTFDIHTGEGDDKSDTVWLHIRGPDGTKAFVDGARYMLTSHINPKASLRNQFEQAWRYLTNPLRVLPDFLIVGAKKCGTTALYSYLTEHPSIAPAYKKEIYFFNAFWGKGKGFYRAYFPTRFERSRGTIGNQPMLTGEATPDYLFHPSVPERIQQLLPKVRLIVILRNPIDRAYSFYNHNLRAGLETLSFEQAIEQEPQRLEGELEKIQADPGYFSYHYMQHSYCTRGVYVDQLQDWARRFDSEQMLVLKTEDLNQSPAETLKTASEFLGLPYHPPAKFKKLNAAPYYVAMQPATREKLQAWFEPHNQRLYEFLGRDLEW
jgi:hypothetical protein